MVFTPAPGKRIVTFRSSPADCQPRTSPTPNCGWRRRAADAQAQLAAVHLVAPAAGVLVVFDGICPVGAGAAGLAARGGTDAPAACYAGRRQRLPPSR